MSASSDTVSLAMNADFRGKGDTVVVFGATGNQGGSVLRSLLNSTEYNIRAITRNANAQAARQLQQLGDRVSLYQADANDETSLKEAFRGAVATFVMTNFWDPANMGREREQGHNIGRAAKAAQVKQVVFSTLPNVKRESGGKWDVPHCTDKAEADEFFRSLEFPFYTSFGASFYYQNLVPGGLLGPDERDTFTLPDIGMRKIDMFDVSQTGDVVLPVFLNPNKYNRRFVVASGDALTFPEAVDVFRAVQQVDYKLKLVKPEEFQRELAQMFEWFREYGVFGNYLADNEAHPVMSLRTLREFLEAEQRHHPKEAQTAPSGPES